MKIYRNWLRSMLVAVMSVALLSQTVVADDPAVANREAIVICLRNMAARAQRFYHTSLSEGGGSGSFAVLTWINLISHPLNAYGSFSLVAPSAANVTLVGTGVETGNDGATPVQAVAVVYSDSVIVMVYN